MVGRWWVDGGGSAHLFILLASAERRQELTQRESMAAVPTRPSTHDSQERKPCANFALMSRCSTDGVGWAGVE